MKLKSKVFRDAANIYLWDGISDRKIGSFEYSCYAINFAYHNYCLNFNRCECIYERNRYKAFYRKNFKPWFSGDIWWNVGWRFWTQAAVQRHRKKMLLKAADLVDKMNGEGK